MKGLELDRWTIGFLAVVMAVGELSAIPVAAQRGGQPGEPAIDFDRARGLLQRENRGERLSADEQAYLDRAKAERARMQGQQGAGRGGVVPAVRESTGMVPLTDLKGMARYKGVEGGLYGKGSNEVPVELELRAKAAAGRVVGLDGQGKAAAGGKMVLLSIGMSNTTQEFSRFKELADRDAGKDSRVVIVDGAQGGQDATAWVQMPEKAVVWGEAERRIKAAGVTDGQVEVIWMKQALKGPADVGEFPRHVNVLAEDMRKIIEEARVRFVNLRLVFLSSRIYAGYATSALNPEPYAYEGAFAVREVVLGQKADGPLILWGPYLWADGVKGRAGDKVVWKAEDFAPDGTHPSASGREKVAGMLLEFFKRDGHTKGWFLKGGSRE